MSVWLVDLVVLLGVGLMSLAVFGALRLPVVFARIHAASKTLVFGVVLVLAGALGSGDGGIIARAVLVAVLLLLTAPVSSHALAWLAYRCGHGDGADADRPER